METGPTAKGSAGVARLDVDTPLDDYQHHSEVFFWKISTDIIYTYSCIGNAGPRRLLVLEAPTVFLLFQVGLLKASGYG